MSILQTATMFLLKMSHRPNINGFTPKTSSKKFILHQAFSSEHQEFDPRQVPGFYFCVWATICWFCFSIIRCSWWKVNRLLQISDFSDCSEQIQPLSHIMKRPPSCSSKCCMQRTGAGGTSRTAAPAEGTPQSTCTQRKATAYSFLPWGRVD